MKYYKYSDEEYFPNGATFIEADGDCALRELTTDGEQWAASNVRHPRWGLVMADCVVDYNDFDFYQPIEKHEFDAAWNCHLARHREAWEKAKEKFPVAKAVRGSIVCFYPQGVVVDLANGVLGIADYALCYASAKPEWMYPQHRVNAIVAGYDEENQWIQLCNPQVLATTVKGICV